jgi:type IV pilus assembly protein PilX
MMVAMKPSVPFRFQSLRPSRQTGAVLVISLLFLLVMTLAAISGMQGSSLEEKMTGNMRDRSLAFHAAESALRQAETLMGSPVNPDFDGTNGLYAVTPANPAFWQQDESWWENSANVRMYSGSLAGLAALPVYIIEQLPAMTPLDPSAVPETDSFRITARGLGGSEFAVVMLQSVYKR